MKTRSFVLLAGLALTAAACSSSTDSHLAHRVRLTIDKTTYHTGETVHVDVENVSDEQLGFPGGFCPVAIQEFRDGAWTGPPNNGACAYSLQLIGPHAHAVAERVIPDGLQGRCRVVLPSPVPENGEIEVPLTIEFSVDSTSFQTYSS
jgi:hypothetical protein